MKLGKKIFDVIKKHNLLHLATVDAHGMPWVRGVDYASLDNEPVLYFMTHKMSRKVDQIKNNPKVAIAIDHDCPDWISLAELKYIKGSAEASIVLDKDEMMMAMELLMKKMPFLANLPGNIADFVVIRLVLNEMFVTDNSVKFGYTENINM